MQETLEIQIWSLGWDYPLEEGIATHSSILAWRIPWTEEPGELYSPWGCRELDTTEATQYACHGYSPWSWEVTFPLLLNCFSVCFLSHENSCQTENSYEQMWRWAWSIEMGNETYPINSRTCFQWVFQFHFTFTETTSHVTPLKLWATWFSPRISYRSIIQINQTMKREFNILLIFLKGHSAGFRVYPMAACLFFLIKFFS